MTIDELSEAKDKDIAASRNALKRAAVEARKLAIQTNTAIVIWEDNRIVRLTAEQLRQESEHYYEP